MSQNAKLRETIDRMVEDAIRRILPSVMNEVLLKVVAGAGVVQEARRPQAPAPTRTRAPAPKPQARPQPRRRKPDLSHILDESAGADFYDMYAPRQPEPEPVYEDEPDEQAPVPVREMLDRRIASLPPGLQEMAEGIDLDDDGGEMWGDDDVPTLVPRGDDAGPLDLSARRAGLDFSRMQQVLGVTERKASRENPEDARARAQFEERRLKLMREQLNGGKPVS